MKKAISGILITHTGFEKALTSSHSIRSFKALQEMVQYVLLDEELFKILRNPDNQAILTNVILEKYFQKTKKLIIDYKEDYLKILEEQIIHDTPSKYTARIKKLEKGDIAEIEEEIYLRNGAFRKIIPRIYNYTCSITGMKVEVGGNISMIDACHIIPFRETHDDTITNGIALCPNMHRAFDRGLISIDKSYRILVSKSFIESYSSYSIHQFENKEIKLPNNQRYYPSQEKLESHRERFRYE